ncbi:Transcriptional regulator [Rubrivivax sp. A210]|uniref:LacI family DNA-binding transcriptional regulator n=1 Tax=Rubrivivax sp. A210 TaxID=2772301 RepID=UPI0019192322|nr:LacI family DNA-binding transcriptional regulator [Rubrivivax sp. A210]CAD5374259.1 Transcriptional regulator [Rubrivivax sp. A210]
MAQQDVQAPRRSRRGSGAVTLHDVARLAGVAPITASRALNHPGQVSDEVRQKVADAVARTGYVPNRLAGGLASARSRLVAAVLPTISGPVFLETVQSLTEALAERGYQLMLGQAGYAGSREDALIEAIVGRRPDGIVLTGIMHSAAGRKRLLASGIPVVETWDLTPTPIDMLVGFSHVEVGRSVARYLYAKGRRRLAVVSGDDERARRRCDAFCAEALALGLAPVRSALVPAPTTLKRGRSGLAELLDADPAIDAVFCSSDLLALGVMTEARVRGVAVPEQLAVVGFGDLDFAADVDPALTTVHIKSREIGRQAAQFIVDSAEGRAIEQRVVDIGFSLVERASSGLG